MKRPRLGPFEVAEIDTETFDMRLLHHRKGNEDGV
jgi:hypothetical protein